MDRPSLPWQPVQADVMAGDQFQAALHLAAEVIQRLPAVVNQLQYLAGTRQQAFAGFGQRQLPADTIEQPLV